MGLFQALFGGQVHTPPPAADFEAGARALLDRIGAVDARQGASDGRDTAPRVDPHYHIIGGVLVDTASEAYRQWYEAQGW